VVTYRHFGTTY